MTSKPRISSSGSRHGVIAFLTIFAMILILLQTPARTAPAAKPGTDLRAWEYRWGDSPADAHGAYLWTLEGPGGAWRPAPALTDPPGREDNSILWMRTFIGEKNIAEPAVYLDCVLHIFEAYHGATRVYRFGTISPARERKFLGRPWHIVPLSDSSGGSYLFLRIYSFGSHIGIPGSVRLGSRPDHITGIIQDDFWRAAVSFMFLLGGCTVMVLYARRRDDLAILSFGASLILMAAWNIGNSRIKLIYLDDPLFWLYAEHTALYLLPAAIGMFLEQLFGRGPYSSIRRGWQALLAMAIVSIAVSAFNPYWLRAFTLRPFQVLMALYMVLLCAVIIRKVWRGDFDARIIAAGLAVAIAFALHDIGVSLLGFSFTVSKISYWGSLAFLLSLGIVLDRRVRVIPARLMSFSAEHYEPRTKMCHGAIDEKSGSLPAITPDIKEKLDRAMDYLREHFTENISREGLAGLVDMNHDYFGKMFLTYTRKKVGVYINELRIALAADLLTNTERNIATIAFEAGFESMSTFYRVFQKVTGLSPSAYRERFGKNGDLAETTQGSEQIE